MPHPTHRRRHRSADRTELWLQRIALWSVVLIGAVVLVMFFVQTKAGLLAVLGAAAVPALIALAVLSCVAARFAAWLRNGLALYSAQTDLGRFMRTNETFRAARRAISRPVH